MGFYLAAGEAFIFALSRLAKRQRFGSDAFVACTGHVVVWLPRLGYASVESCRAEWRAANGETADVPAEVGASSVVVPEMDELFLLLKKDAGWT